MIAALPPAERPQACRVEIANRRVSIARWQEWAHANGQPGAQTKAADAISQLRKEIHRLEVRIADMQAEAGRSA